MASSTKQTEIKRVRRDRKSGKTRKRQLEKKGSTRTEAELFGNELSK